MKYFLTTLCLFLVLSGINAQTPVVATTRLELDRFMVDANGRMLKPTGDFDEEGSPFYAKEFYTGTVTILKGKTYHGLKLKINFNTNEVIFIDNNGNEMVVAQPIEKITLETPNGTKVFRTGFEPIEKLDGNAIYEVLDSGKVSYLKYTDVSFSERQPYPNARYTRTYRDQVSYYIAIGNSVKKLPKSIDEVPALFGDKASQVSALIKKEKLKIKKESDLIQVFKYANSL